MKKERYEKPKLVDFSGRMAQGQACLSVGDIYDPGCSAGDLYRDAPICFNGDGHIECSTGSFPLRTCIHGSNVLEYTNETTP